MLWWTILGFYFANLVAIKGNFFYGPSTDSNASNVTSTQQATTATQQIPADGMFSTVVPSATTTVKSINTVALENQPLNEQVKGSFLAFHDGDRHGDHDGYHRYGRYDDYHRHRRFDDDGDYYRHRRFGRSSNDYYPYDDYGFYIEKNFPQKRQLVARTEAGQSATKELPMNTTEARQTAKIMPKRADNVEDVEHWSGNDPYYRRRFGYSRPWHRRRYWGDW